MIVRILRLFAAIFSKTTFWTYVVYDLYGVILGVWFRIWFLYRLFYKLKLQ